ncbi:MAG: hypothetical protein Q9227_003931 [Pyrenula ochraceoflavens]
MTLLINDNHSQLLAVIEKLKGEGIEKDVDLPKLVVCGEQKAGKSSTLEAISGLQFPADDALCTRFPTEITTEHGPYARLSATITPSSSRPQVEQEQMKTYWPKETSLDQLGSIIDQARKVLGVGGPRQPAFVNDILHIKASAPNLTQASITDLPGLFHGHGDHQNAEDGPLVREMVRSFIRQPRTIILAVLSAEIERTSQEITKMVSDEDPDGVRTLGIITNPDAAVKRPSRAASYVNLLLGNDRQKLVFGWHVIRNRDQQQLQDGISTAERDRFEAECLSQAPWNKVPTDRKGRPSLLIRLAEIMYFWTIKEAPGIIDDVERVADSYRHRLSQLRTSTTLGNEADVREKLFAVEHNFRDLLRQAISGHYSNPAFFSKKKVFQLRSQLEVYVERFETEINTSGTKLGFVNVDWKETDTKLDHPLGMAYDMWSAEIIQKMQERSIGIGPLKIDFVSDIFYDYTAPWPTLIQSLLESLCSETTTCLTHILHHVTGEQSALTSILKENLIDPEIARLHQEFSKSIHANVPAHSIRAPLMLSDREMDKVVRKGREIAQRIQVMNTIGKHFNIDVELTGKSWSTLRLPPTAIKSPADADTLRDTFVGHMDLERSASIEVIEAVLELYEREKRRMLGVLDFGSIQRHFLTPLSDVVPLNTFPKFAGQALKATEEDLDIRAQRTELTERLSILEQAVQELQALQGSCEDTCP